MKKTVWILFISILLSHPLCLAGEKTSFGKLLKQMLLNNELIINQKSTMKQEAIDQRTTSRFNAPVLTGSLSQSAVDLYQDQPFSFETSQDVTQFGLGIQGSLPRYGLGYSFEYNQTEQSQDSFAGGSALDSTAKSYTLGLEIDLLENAGFLVGDVVFEEQEEEYQLAKSAYNQQVQTNVLNLVKLYLNVTLAQQNIENAMMFQKQAEKLAENYGILFKEGRLSKVELLSAKIQVNNQKSVLYSLQLEFRRFKRELFAFVGGFSEVEINQDWFFSPLRSGILTNDLDHEALSSRAYNPDVDLIKKQINLSNLRLRAANNRVLPTLKFTTGYQKNENRAAEPLTGTELGSDRYSVGLNLSIPLDNIGAQADRDKEKILQYYLKMQEDILSKNVNMVVDGIKAEISEIKTQIEINRENLEMAKQRYKSALPLVRINSAARIDIFFYQNELTSIQYRLAELEAALIGRRADILYARGQFGFKKALK